MGGVIIEAPELRNLRGLDGLVSVESSLQVFDVRQGGPLAVHARCTRTVLIEDFAGITGQEPQARRQNSRKRASFDRN